MLKKSLLLIVLATAPVLASAPLKLVFAKGETMQYKVTIAATEASSFKGDTLELRMTGSQVMTMKVSSVSGGAAKMSVGYSGATASATALSLPAEVKKDKAKIEQAATKAMKASLLSGARSQTVRSNGVASYTMKAGEGQSLTIEGGAFMMLVLPAGEPTLNKSWTANIRQPMPGAPSLPCKFKWVGNITKNGRPLRKIAVAMSQSKSNQQGEVTLSMSESVTGYVLFDSGRGKVLEGVIERTAKQTAKHSKEGTRTQVQESQQSFVKF
ncbi:MAG: hypothetical protein M3R13_04580 [Armatimonadota bacterium]|nr:hypothetical protein [Armatimonadota bacterium]